MSVLLPTDRIQRNPEVAWRAIGEHLILVPIAHHAREMDAVFTLTGVGPFLWQLLADSPTFAVLCDSTVAEYEVTRERATEDIRTFVDELIAAGAIRVLKA